MSIKIPLTDLSEEQKIKVSTDLTFRTLETKYNKNVKEISCFELDQDNLYLPYAYAVKKGWAKPVKNLFTQTNTKFVGELRDEQKVVKTEAISALNKNGSTILSLHVGWGKSAFSVYLATKIGLKSIVLCHRIILIDQWKDTILRFCPTAKIQILKDPKKKIDPSCDFYIINAGMVPKFGWVFGDIGILIADEIHTMATDVLSKAFFYLTPRYLIGLSATPERPDGMDSILTAYFGEDKIHRKLQRSHNVYLFKTGFTPDSKIGVTGRVDWNSVIESQSSSVERNLQIIKMVKYFKDRYILILCKRISQAEWLIDRLSQEGEDVTSLIGIKRSFNTESRVLVATIQKVGCGFNHPKLNMLIMATDAEEYFIQYLGRVMRTQEGEPMIVDMLDNNGILKKHYLTRRHVYLDHGGIIKDFNKEFPDF